MTNQKPQSHLHYTPSLKGGMGWVLILLLMSLTTKATIQPANWWVGMKNPTLQLMISQPGVRDAEVSIDYPGVRLTEVVRLESPNYLLLYLDLSQAEAGDMPINLRIGRKTTRYNVPLLQREMPGEARQGFTNADVLYMLMPDRFAQGEVLDDRRHYRGMKKRDVDTLFAQYFTQRHTDRQQPSARHGGNLEGIRQHLDYFTDLGVTALWLTPVLENNSPDSRRSSSYHGYATTDYYRVDPYFGTNEQYRTLVQEAHQKGLKIVMDMIFNHCGFHHPWVADMPSSDWFNRPEWLLQQQKGQGGGRTNSAYLGTSYKLTPVLDPYASQVDLAETTEGWFVPSMPDLNQRNPHVMRYLIQNSFWWIETVGIDGIRMDTYPYAFKEGMAQWMRELLDEYPHFNVVGETWVNEPAYTAAWQRGFISSNQETPQDSAQRVIESNLPTVMDFSFQDKIGLATKVEETDQWANGFNRIYNNFVYDYLYPRPSSVMAFLDNHDTDRFLGDGADTLALRQALAILLTCNRIPQIYYGTEVLMKGTKRATDGNVRRDFPGGWPGDKKNAFTGEGLTRTEQANYRWVQKLLHWRQGNEAIIHGTQTQWCPVNGIYVLARRTDTQTVMTIVNGRNAESTFRAQRYAEAVPQGTIARDVLTGRQYDLSKDFTLTARQTLVVEY